MKDLADTICALSTAPGRSGLAIVRVSGPQSVPLLGRIFLPQKSVGEVSPRQATLGRIADPRSGLEIDEAVVTCFPSPKSYTGEDMIEYSLHGSPVLIAQLLDSLCALGARLRSPANLR